MKNGPLGLVFVAQFADMVHLYPYPREPIVGPTFGYRFSDVSEIERGKGKQLFLIVQAVYHFFFSW